MIWPVPVFTWIKLIFTIELSAMGLKKKIQNLLIVNLIFFTFLWVSEITQYIYLWIVSGNSDKWSHAQMLFFINNQLAWVSIIMNAVLWIVIIANVFIFILLIIPIFKNLFTFKHWFFSAIIIFLLFILTTVTFMIGGVILALFLKRKYRRKYKTIKTESETLI